MKKQFIKNTFELTATALLTRTMGLIFRAYMTNKLGSSGIGLYSIIIMVYGFFVTVTVSSFNLVSTRLITDSFAEQKPSKALYYLRCCILLCVCVATVMGAILFFGANIVANLILNDARCVLSLKILALSLPFVGLSSCFRGYFFSRRKAGFTATEQILEQVVEFAVFAALIDNMLPRGVEYACASVVIGTLLGEIVSAIYTVILYIYDEHLLRAKATKCKGFLKQYLNIGLPVTASSCLRSGMSMVETSMIPTGLTKYGANRDKSLAQYGEIVGLAMPILTFPDLFLSAFTTLMIPEMSDAKAQKRVNGIKYMAQKVLGATYIFSVIIMVVFYYFGELIGLAIFGKENVGIYVKILAPLIPLWYIDRVADGMLKGLGEQVFYLAYNIIDSVIRVVLTIILLPKFGVMGVIVMLYVSAILNLGFSTSRLVKIAKIELKLKKLILPPLVAVLVCKILSVLIFLV